METFAAFAVSRSPARKYSAKHSQPFTQSEIPDPGSFQISGQLITEIGSNGLGHKGFYDHWSKIEEKQGKCTVVQRAFKEKEFFKSSWKFKAWNFSP